MSIFQTEQFELFTHHPVKAEGADQNARIIAHLRSGRSLTALDALEFFKCFRLASRIHDIKRQGWDVQKRTVKTNSGKSVAEYYLA